MIIRVLEPARWKKWKWKILIIAHSVTINHLLEAYPFSEKTGVPRMIIRIRVESQLHAHMGDFHVTSSPPC